GATYRPGVKRAGWTMDGGGNEACDRPLAPTIPRRRAREERLGHHRRRHLLEHPGALGRSRQQHAAGEDREPTADPLGCARRAHTGSELSRGPLRSGVDLPESTEPESLRRREQWFHVSRIRLPEQRA